MEQKNNFGKKTNANKNWGKAPTNSGWNKTSNTNSQKLEEPIIENETSDNEISSADKLISENENPADNIIATNQDNPKKRTSPYSSKQTSAPFQKKETIGDPFSNPPTKINNDISTVPGKKSKFPIIIICVALILFLAVGYAVYYFVFSDNRVIDLPKLMSKNSVAEGSETTVSESEITFSDTAAADTPTETSSVTTTAETTTAETTTVATTAETNSETEAVDNSVDINDFCEVMNGIWVDESSVHDDTSGYEFFMFSEQSITYGKYYTDYVETGNIEKVEVNDEGVFTLSVHYPLVDNELSYSPERYDVLEMIYDIDSIVINNITYTYWGKSFEETEETHKQKFGKSITYQEAYTQFLFNYAIDGNIDDYRFDIYDLDNDNTPELFISNGYWDEAQVKAYTFDNGQVLPLTDSSNSYIISEFGNCGEVSVGGGFMSSYSYTPVVYCLSIYQKKGNNIVKIHDFIEYDGNDHYKLSIDDMVVSNSKFNEEISKYYDLVITPIGRTYTYDYDTITSVFQTN